MSLTVTTLLILAIAVIGIIAVAPRLRSTPRGGQVAFCIAAVGVVVSLVILWRTP